MRIIAFIITSMKQLIPLMLNYINITKNCIPRNNHIQKIQHFPKYHQILNLPTQNPPNIQKSRDHGQVFSALDL